MFNWLSNRSFRIQSPIGNADANRQRFATSLGQMDDVLAEIASKRLGLKTRYDEACVSASFTLGGPLYTKPTDKDETVSDLATSVWAYERPAYDPDASSRNTLAAAKATIGSLMLKQPFDLNLCGQAIACRATRGCSKKACRGDVKYTASIEVLAARHVMCITASARCGHLVGDSN